MNRSIHIRAALAVLVGSAAVMTAVAAPASAATHAPRGHAEHAVHGHLTKPAPAKPAPATGDRTRASTAGSNALSLSLTESSASVLVTQYITFTASATQPIGAGEHITIWDDSDANAVTVIADCTSGTTCSGVSTHDTLTDGLIYAAIVDGSDTLASTYAYPTWQEVDVESLTADQTTVGVGGTVTLTAKMSANIGPTSLWLDYFDTSTGAYIGQCDGLTGDGSTCVTTVSQPAAGTHTYRAYLVVGGSTFYPPSQVEARSFPTAYITWTPGAYRVSLAVNQYGSYDSATVLTASTNAAVNAPYFIDVYDEENGALVGACSGGTTCTVTDRTPPEDWDEYVAFVASFSTALPPGDIQASSPTDEVFVRPIP